MLSLAEFQKLRLRTYCANDQLYSEEREEHGDYLVESIRGIWFLRPAETPEATCTISLDFRDNSTDCCDAIFAAIRLPLNRCDDPHQIVSKLGCDPVFIQDVPSIRATNYYFRPGPFVVCCSFLQPLTSTSFWSVEISDPAFRDSLAYAQEALRRQSRSRDSRP